MNLSKAESDQRNRKLRCRNLLSPKSTSWPLCRSFLSIFHSAWTLGLLQRQNTWIDGTQGKGRRLCRLLTKDLNLFQVDDFFLELQLVLLSDHLGAEVPMIIGGDLNSQPQSSLYEHFSTGLALWVTKILQIMRSTSWLHIDFSMGCTCVRRMDCLDVSHPSLTTWIILYVYYTIYETILTALLLLLWWRFRIRIYCSAESLRKEKQMKLITLNGIRTTWHWSHSFRSYHALHKFLQPCLLQAMNIAPKKCNWPSPWRPCSFLYTIGPPDVIGCCFSFGIIRGICNQCGVHFAYTSQRSTYA